MLSSDILSGLCLVLRYQIAVQVTLSVPHGPGQSPDTTNFTQIYCHKSCNREIPYCAIWELRCYGCTEHIVGRRHYAQAQAQAQFRETPEHMYLINLNGSLYTNNMAKQYTIRLTKT